MVMGAATRRPSLLGRWIYGFMAYLFCTFTVFHGGLLRHKSNRPFILRRGRRAAVFPALLADLGQFVQSERHKAYCAGLVAV